MKKLSAILAIILCLIMLVGCAAKDAGVTEPKDDAGTTTPADDTGTDDTTTPPEDTSADNGALKSDKDIVIGVTSRTMKEAVYVMAKDAATARAEEYGGKVTLEWIACELDVAVQMNQVETFIAKGVDVIVIEPPQTDAVANVKQLCDAAEIPVIIYDGLPSDTGVTYWLTAHYVDIMPMQVEEFVKVWGTEKSAKAVIIGGTMGESQVQEMVQSCKDAIAKYPNIEIVYTQFHQDWDRQLAMNTMEAVLEQYPDVNAVFCCNDTMAHGCYKAAQNVGKENDIYFYGADFDKDTAEMILSGVENFVVINRGAENQGRGMVDMAVEIANGYDLTYDEVQANPVTGEDMYCKWVPMSLVNTETIEEQCAERYPDLLS